jgi:hypothetical protein
MRLSQTDIDILASLRAGVDLIVGTHHRFRLELEGLVADTANGLRLTPKGRAASLTKPTVEVSEVQIPGRKVDTSGRKKMFERFLPILSA